MDGEEPAVTGLPRRIGGGHPWGRYQPHTGGGSEGATNMSQAFATFAPALEA